MNHIPRHALAFLALVTGIGCSSAKPPAVAEESASAPVVQPGPPASPIDAPPAADTITADSASVARLERRARAIARTRGCTRTEDCRVAPLGARPCGGPRDYIAYCAASTDTVALFRTLRELERAERAFNERSHMMGSCQMLLPPVATLAGGSCGMARTP